jgi:hypothetical protein
MSSGKGRQAGTSLMDELRRNSSSSSTVSSVTNSSYINDTFLPHLHIGDNGASRDMITVSNRAINFKMANSLQTHDFAFVLRSNGEWTYAIVAHRGLVDTLSGDVIVAHNELIEASIFAHKGLIKTSSDDVLLVVVDLAGRTKTLTRKCWSTCIRMVNSDTMSSLIDMLQPPACRKEDTMHYLADVFEPADNLQKKNWANPTQLKNIHNNKGNLPPTPSLLDPLPRGAGSCTRFPALIGDLQAPPFVIDKRWVQYVHFVQDESAKLDPVCKSSENNIVPPLPLVESCLKEARYSRSRHSK